MYKRNLKEKILIFLVNKWIIFFFKNIKIVSKNIFFLNNIHRKSTTKEKEKKNEFSFIYRLKL